MQVVKPKMTKTNLLRTDYSSTFRFEEYFLGKQRNNFVYLNNVLNNPYVRYELITEPLVAGAYKFKIFSTDKLNNINAGVEKTATITNRLWYPENFVISLINGNDITFTWTAPVAGTALTHYKIYGNGGTGYVIDYVTALATVVAGVYTTTITVADGNWLFVIESVNGAVKTLNHYTINQIIPITDVPPEDPGGLGGGGVKDYDKLYVVKNVHLQNYTIGKCKITFIWNGLANVSHFRIYHDSGTGTIDWNTYVFRYAKLVTRIQTFITDQIINSVEEATYKFGIRAETSSGVIDANVTEYSVVLDGIAPDEVVNSNAEVV